MVATSSNPRAYEQGDRNDLPMASSTVLYKGSAIGKIDGTGLVRLLVAGDAFCGFQETDENVLSGIGFPTNVLSRVIDKGKVVLPITGVTVTDIGLPVYATDDVTYSMSPVGGSFVGFLHRFVSAGIGVVKFDTFKLRDPYDGYQHQLKSANYTVANTDAGSWIWVDTDAVVITLPALPIGLGFRVGNIAAFGVSGLTISPNSVDNIRGWGITAADNKGLINTKATSRRGDYVQLGDTDANGWTANKINGTWVRVA